MNKPSDRCGFILPAALACIVLIAILASAALFAGSQESRAATAELLDQQASSYAERVALLAISSWSCGMCDSAAVGSVIIGNPQSDPPLESTLLITRLDSALFLVVGEGRVTAGGATRLARRVSIVIRTSVDSLGATSALPLAPHAWAAIYGM
jgi:type II secretory pathway pseudopilin PulG